MHRKEDYEAYEEAEMYVKKALDIEPQSVEAREALRFLLYKKVRHHVRKNGKFSQEMLWFYGQGVSFRLGYIDHPTFTSELNLCVLFIYFYFCASLFCMYKKHLLFPSK